MLFLSSFLFCLDAKKKQKKSRQTRSLRALCRATRLKDIAVNLMAVGTDTISCFAFIENYIPSAHNSLTDAEVTVAQKLNQGYGRKGRTSFRP
jgi:hypothetical protein